MFNEFPLRMPVTAAHINQGEPLDGNECAIACAARDFLEVDDVTVHECDGTVLTAAGERYEVDDEGKRFIEAFDDGEVVEPCTIGMRFVCRRAGR